MARSSEWATTWWHCLHSSKALVDPVLVAGPRELGGDLGREPIAPDPADHLVHAEVDQRQACPALL
jgi:hypothetical protein